MIKYDHRKYDVYFSFEYYGISAGLLEIHKPCYMPFSFHHTQCIGKVYTGGLISRHIHEYEQLA